MSTPLITINHLRKTFSAIEGSRRVEVLEHIKLTIHKGEFLVLLGPSGCGKSPLLRIIAGLDTATGGDISYSADFNPERVSFVFQNFGILPWLSVFQNIELNLIALHLSPHEQKERVHDMLQAFGLTAFKDHFPHELSGGMRQRVGLARAFASKPELIFLDEPFSELDFFTAKSLRQLLIDMWRKEGTTVVMVSHYIDEAVSLADRIAVFSDRPSTITQIVSNTLPRPREARSQSFFALEDEVLSKFEGK